jgi:hypothetical protein
MDYFVLSDTDMEDAYDLGEIHEESREDEDIGDGYELEEGEIPPSPPHAGRKEVPPGSPKKRNKRDRDDERAKIINLHGAITNLHGAARTIRRRRKRSKQRSE